MNFSTFSGLGDAVYSFPIVRELTQRGPVTLWTRYPDVFASLPLIRFTAEKAGTVLGYSRGPGRNFYDDMVRASGLTEAPGFSAMFPVLDKHIEWAKSKGGPIVLLKEPHATDMHKRSNDFSLAASADSMQRFIDNHRASFYFVAVDGPDDLYKARLSNIDERISGLTVREYLSLCSVVSAFASQIGHLVPIAQALGKHLYLFEPERNVAQNTRHIRAASVIVRGCERWVEVRS